jgi:hypothetical protein
LTVTARNAAIDAGAAVPPLETSAQTIDGASKRVMLQTKSSGLEGNSPRV